MSHAPISDRVLVLNDPASRCIMKQPEGPSDKYLSREAKQLVLSTPMVQQLARDGGAEHWVSADRAKQAGPRSRVRIHSPHVRPSFLQLNGIL